MLGAAGFVAPRHMQAIHETGNDLVAACDPYDGVGILDRFFPGARFFTEVERFDRHLEKLRRRDDPKRVDYVSICTPNYLHDAHVRLALRVRAHAICEKPLVISPWNLEQLEQIEAESGTRVYNVLQLRLHPAVLRLKAQLGESSQGGKADIVLTYVTRRGPWYHVSWKGVPEKSGTVAMNIGIHFFDLLMFLFGDVEDTAVHLQEPDRMAGALELERARVRWFLSIDSDDLPEGYLAEGKPAHRAITVDGEEIDLSSGFTGLHTRVYEDILSGGGFGIEHARPSIDLVHRIRNDEIQSPGDRAHPLLKR